MSLDATAAFLSSNNRISAHAIYVFEFEGFSDKFSTDRVIGGAGTYLIQAERPKSLTSSSDQRTGRAVVSQINFVLTDVLNNATRLIAADVHGKNCTVYMGYEDLAWANYVVRFAGKVEAIKMTSDQTGYDFTLRARDALANRDAFDVPATHLSSPMVTGDTQALVESAAGFDGKGVFIVNQELVGYANRTDGRLFGLTRGVHGTTPADHNAGRIVTEVLVLGPSHPIDIALSVLKDSGKRGLSIPAADIDEAAFNSAKTVLGGEVKMQFFVARKRNGKKFLEEQIFLATGSIPIQTADGRIGVQPFEDPGTLAVAADITDEDLVDTQRPSWEVDVKEIVNSVEYLYDHSVEDGKYGSKISFTDPPSVRKFGQIGIAIEHEGFRLAIAGTREFMAERGAHFLSRFSSAPPFTRLRLKFKHQVLSAGDIIRVTLSELPKRGTSDRGVRNVLFEIVEQQVDFQREAVWVKMIDATFFPFSTAWAPSGLPNYSGASDLQKKRYAWWADAQGENEGVAADDWLDR